MIETSGTTFGPNVAIAQNAIVGEGCNIGANSYIGPWVTIGPGCIIGPGAVIGSPGFGFSRSEEGGWVDKEHRHGVTIGADVHIGANTCIDAGSWRTTLIMDGARIDNLVHIAHNVLVGSRAVIVAQAEVSGSVTIGSEAWIGPCACIIQRVTIGRRALVGMGAVVLQDVAAHTTVAGCPARVIDDTQGVREEM